MHVAALIPRRQMSAVDALLANGSAGAISDTHLLQTPCHGLRFLASGNVTIRDEFGNISVIAGVAGNDVAGFITQIRATGTAVSAANLVLLWGP